MKSNEFVKQINHVRQKLNAFLEVKSNIAIVWIIEKMKIVPKIKMSIYNNEIAALLGNYLLNDFVVGKVTLYNKIEYTIGKVFFGEIELDKLYIDTETHEIKLLGFESNACIMECSRNDTDFLNLLFLYIEYTAIKIMDQDASELITLERLQKLSGGGNYLQFSKFLFDVYS